VSEQAQPAAGSRKSWLRVSAIVAIPFVILLALMLPIGKWRQRPLHLKTCLTVADDLRSGASVRISGVEVGIVRKVQVRPDDHACPIMVEMALQTGYELKIPRDSRTYSDAAGLLGPAYVGIDSSSATGTPIEDWGTLPSKVVAKMGTEEFLNDLERSLKQADKSLQESREEDKKKQAAPTTLK
jgi:ABC-type transporter Mla subunit MlaD